MSTDRPRRKYDSPLREAAAAATEARIVDSAADLFNQRGYAGTTIADIARAAEVSVPRVNLSGSKTSLLVAAYWKRVGGHPDTEMVTDTDLMRELMSLPTDDALRAYAEWIHATHQQSAGLWFALRSAATADEEAARMLEAISERNRRDCDVAVAWAQQRGLLTGDVSLTERAEVWGLLGCAETWHRMITMMGWTKERYTAWILRTLRVTVFDLA